MGLLEAGARHAHRHRRDQRAGVVEGLHRAREAARVLDLGAAEQGLLGHAAVLEPERGGVRGADAQLVLQALEHQPGVGALDHERLDRRAALARVQRRPHHHQLGALPGGHVDLLAVEHPLVAVLDGRGADRRRVRPRLGLGDGHRRPAARVELGLLLVGHRGDGRVAEALAGKREQQPDVAPAHLDDHARARFGRCGCDRRRRPPRRWRPAPPVPPPSFIPSISAASMSSSFGRSCSAMSYLREIGRSTSAATWWACSTSGLSFLGVSSDDHQTSSAPSITPAARRSRYQRSTGCSFT